MPMQKIETAPGRFVRVKESDAERIARALPREKRRGARDKARRAGSNKGGVTTAPKIAEDLQRDLEQVEAQQTAAAEDAQASE